MSRSEDLHHVLDRGLVAILRAPSGERLVEVAEALYEGGIDVIEVTFTVPGAAEIISEVSRRMGDRILLGAGSILDAETARIAILAGANFVVAPVVSHDVISMCHRYDKLVMPGAFTPTEVLSAWDAGADVVKIFPAETGGPAHLKALKGPLPQVRMMPTGGVNLETLPKFVAAGACAVGLGGSLVEKTALANGDMNRIRDLAGQYVNAMRHAREENG
ncbi:bifunctional 4-hydroxy-2-oxoglutarate aldolase/2-dehydro-3-deoxy-phosphogluconate aldolase [Thalassoroseus pseudoceratinae]|uniref:bifunctional 4-hydroxy-2-oxoglutarate aldolase/2-dehydro-3-deoxy-phosphogluconate aldolase n=1 Tax=Thalassoroseus pseudoceratinae TaxID=2713176 RepID=UPI001422F211|nr:bifunctional 4-hydroxy-2-oxoglutarate aldolase/2-dehydro-3-deoxy-phosphogluconate aldolase [Thalassoroseus pseudoceratinae]